MLESFFILSLGITVVLVLFLVYHFKQRITVLENKCDTTFEIINNVVSELGHIRGAINHGSQTQMPDFTCSQAGMLSMNNRINVEISEDGDSDDENSEDGDSDDENSADGDSDDENSEDGDSDDENNTHEDNVGTVESTTIRIVNMDNQPELDVVDIIDDNIQNEFNDDDQPTIENLDNTNIIVDKLHNTDSHLDDVSVTSSVAEIKMNDHIYKKMTLSALKAYVIEKGIMSDPSKMKKHEIIQAIESSEI